jgi:hypothetical protein
LDLNAANYGYPHSSVEDSVKALSHAVTLTGLIPGTTYYYRAVSRGSLAVSQSYSFNTLSGPMPQVKGASTENPAAENISENGAINPIQNQNNTDPQPIASQIKGAQVKHQGVSNTAANNPKDQGASVLGVSSADNQTRRFNFLWWTLIIFSIFCLWQAQASKKWRDYWIAGIAILLVFTAMGLIAGSYYLSWKLFLPMVVALLLALLSEKKFSRDGAKSIRKKSKRAKAAKVNRWPDLPNPFAKAST